MESINPPGNPDCFMGKTMTTAQRDCKKNGHKKTKNIFPTTDGQHICQCANCHSAFIVEDEILRMHDIRESYRRKPVNKWKAKGTYGEIEGYSLS